MNEDTIESDWKHLKGKAGQWWGQLTDDDLDKIEGNRDKLVERIQKRYGKSKEEAERQVKVWEQEHTGTPHI